MNEKETITIPLKDYQALQSTVAQLEHEFAWLKRQLISNKSECYIPNNQQTELEIYIEKNAVEVTKQDVSYTRTSIKKTCGHSRKEIPTHLPYENIVIEPKEDIGGCEKIGEEISWECEHNPGSLFVRRYIRSKYADKTQNKILIIAAYYPCILHGTCKKKV